MKSINLKKEFIPIVFNNPNLNYNNIIEKYIDFDELIPDLLLLAYEKSNNKEIYPPSNLDTLYKENYKWINCITYEFLDNDLYAIFWFNIIKEKSTRTVKLKLRENHFNMYMII